MVKLTKRQEKRNKKMILISILLVLIGALALFTAPKINEYIKANKFMETAAIQTALENQNASVASVITDNTEIVEALPIKEVEAQKVIVAKINTTKANTEAGDSVAKIRAQAESEKIANQALIAKELQSGMQSLRDAEIKRLAEAEKISLTNTAYLNKLSAVNKSFSVEGLELYNSAITSYNAGDESAALATLAQAKAVFQTANDQAVSLNTNNSNMPKNYMEAGEDMKNATYNAVKATDEIILIIGTHSANSTGNYGEQLESYGSKVKSFLISQGYK